VHGTQLEHTLVDRSFSGNRILEERVEIKFKSKIQMVYFHLFMAERVGFVPDEPASLNNLGAIATARIRQIH